MKQPVISIIIPVYNVEGYIEKCACSLFEQTYENMEFIFIDDHSTDSSLEKLMGVIKKYPDYNIKIIQHEMNKGAATSRNDGLCLATGDYIGFVDADDWVEPEMYQQMYDTMEHNNADVLTCDFYYEYKDKTEIGHSALPAENKVALFCHYLISPLNSVCNMLIKADILRENEIRFLEGFDWCEDLNFSSKVYYFSHRVYSLKKPLYHYRDNLASYCHTTSTKKYVSRLKNVLDLYDFLKNKEIYGEVKEYLFYRILLSKQFYLYETKEITAYMTVCPEANAYILSNPLYGKKAKVVEYLSVVLYSFILKLLSVKI